MSATQHVVPLTNLHDRAIALFHTLRLRTERHGIPPTIRELADSCGIPSLSHTKRYLDTLVDRGLVVHIPHESRAYRLPPEKEPAVTPPAAYPWTAPTTAAPFPATEHYGANPPQPVFAPRADADRRCRICDDPLPPIDDTPYHHPDVERMMREETVCATHAWLTLFDDFAHPILDADPVGVAS